MLASKERPFKNVASLSQRTISAHKNIATLRKIFRKEEKHSIQFGSKLAIKEFWQRETKLILMQRFQSLQLWALGENFEEI